MKLSTYLDREHMTPAQFAERMGKPASTISRLLNGEREPRIGLLEEICAATNGEVQPNDFMELAASSKARSVA